MSRVEETLKILTGGVEILVVEDSPTQAEQLRCILEQQEYRVVVARNGKEALSLIRERRPALVITDVIMPEMDGYQLCRAIKDDYSLRCIPVILLTSLSDPVDVIRGLQHGADNFITKPYNAQFLLSRIRHILINVELRKSGSAEMGIEVFFAGEKHFLTAERIQIIDLLLSTFENAVQKNRELEHSNQELKKALETIKILETNYRTLLEKNADAMVVVDQRGIVRYANPSAEVLFGRKAAEMVGRPFDFPVAAGETKEVRITRTDGETVIAEMRTADTTWGGVSAYLASLRDVTENVQLREQLRNLSLTDELTGLYNRRGFFTMAQQQMKAAGQTGREMYLLFVDLDDMKWINDTFGHQEGDRALVETANILRETFRGSDIITRIGGDEFAVIVTGVQKGSADILVSRLRERLEAHNARNSRPYRLSLSVGVAYYDPQSPCSITELLARADRLMYRQKREQGDANRPEP
ncbi:MAG: diguanylate cyclase [Peptococcaceae bacterium]|nr:diguanylate cyclase [Peptococcaceae bacterium]